MINFFKHKIHGRSTLLGTMFFTLFIGLIIGAQWHRLYIFPFPQLNEWRRGAEWDSGIVFQNIELGKQVDITIYSKKAPIFLDRLYFDSIGDNRLEGLYLVRIPRHYSDAVRIKSSKDLVIYRAISDYNNNIHYDIDNWEPSDIPINIGGLSTLHTEIIKKPFPANNVIELASGGPNASDPIFIKVKDYVAVAPSLEFMILN